MTAFDGGASASGIEGGHAMILRTAILSAMVLCTASLAMADEVLYCTDTAVTGFYWDNSGNVALGSSTKNVLL